MKFTDVVAEIKAVKDRVREEFGMPDRQVITNRVIANHADISGEDVDFYRVCAFKAVSAEARHEVNREKMKEAKGKQLTLEGFEHLQQYYQVARDGTLETVKVQDMSDAELDEKAALYESMGHACLAHADELRRYRDTRDGSNTTGVLDLGDEPRPSIND